jgi:predicted AAA+ superfamily ATPase
MIKRVIEVDLVGRLKEGNKSVILYGPRQVGKTTLSMSVIEKLGVRTMYVNGDDKTYNDVLSSQDLKKIDQLVSGYDLLFIDEAQRIENIGINMKLIIDSHPEMKIFATGSSSFDLANKVSEPLTGRVWTYNLYPISSEEILNHGETKFDFYQKLEEYMLFGGYPEVFSYKTKIEKIAYLKQLTNSYLYKDILEYADIKHADKIDKLLRLIALQIGNEVSLSELAATLNISKETVGRYLDLLEKSFVIFTLRSFNKNLRKEVSKMNKIYFFDPGVRNSIIENFSPLSNRTDGGSMFENYLIVERLKHNQYHQNFVSSYFWRLSTGAEMDYVETGEGKLKAFELKFGKNKSKSKESWLKAYPEADFGLVNRENYLEFIGGKN